MLKNAWFTLILGLLAGLVLGYVLAEQQRVGPAQARPAAGGLPEGHPAVAGGAPQQTGAPVPQERVQELLGLLAQSPEDSRLMVQLGNIYYDAERWQEARMWYERARELEAPDPNLDTDLAVVYRSLGQPEKALEMLDEAIETEPDHWQAWYNKVVILHFDLHRHDEAAAALARLEELASADPEIPDLGPLAAEVEGTGR